ncbi:hypothetical protein [Gelidibacter sp.]|nr:hypothetical protein [Gelidibacter sp.]HUH29446.1 hypothetical protein [Gelidibacter sp.]
MDKYKFILRLLQSFALTMNGLEFLALSSIVSVGNYGKAVI